MNEQDIYDDLTTTNELGDGEREYFVDDGLLYLSVYGEGSEVEHVYRIDVQITEVHP